MDLHLILPTKDYVGDEEYCRGNVVLIADQAKVLVHSFNLSIADVASIDMCQEVENAHDWNQTEVDLRDRISH